MPASQRGGMGSVPDQLVSHWWLTEWVLGTGSSDSAFLPILDTHLHLRKILHLPDGNSGFGGLDVACWPLVTKFVGSNPAEAVGFFMAKKFGRRAEDFVIYGT